MGGHVQGAAHRPLRRHEGPADGDRAQGAPGRRLRRRQGPADTGLDHPAGTITITLKDNAGKYVLHVGKSASATSFYAQKEGDPTIYTVSKAVAEWATADVSKFQKVADAGAATASAKAPPRMPPGMGMPGGMPPGHPPVGH